MKIKIKCLNTSSNSTIKFYLMFPSVKRGWKIIKYIHLFFCDNFIDFFFFHYSLQHLCLVIFVLFYGRKKLCKYLRHMLANKEFYVFQCHIIYNQKTTLMQYVRGCGKCAIPSWILWRKYYLTIYWKFNHSTEREIGSSCIVLTES